VEWGASKAALVIGVAVGAVGAGAFVSLGAPLPASAAAGLLAAGAAGGAWLLHRRMNRLSGEITSLRLALAEERDRNDAFFTELQRRTVESPALVWRAATADIEVLGSLLRDLARTLGDHERRLDALFREPEPIAPLDVTPEPDRPRSPAQEPIPAVTVEPEQAPGPEQGTAFVMGELRSTLAVALASERLELTLQPVVQLPQRRIGGYEAGLRLKADDGAGDAPDLGRIASVTGMRADLDRALLDRAIQALRVLKARNGAITMRCAVAATSLGDELVLSLLRGQLSSEPDFAPALILEIAADELPAVAPDRLTEFRRIGLTVGLSAHNLAVDPARLAQLGIRHLRLYSRDFLGALANVSPSASIHPADVPELLGRRGIDLIIDGVSTEEEVRELLDYPIAFGQGALFGAARGVKPDKLRAPDPTEAKPAPEPPRESPPPKPARTSFRSLLRRA
jgi:cyclic-di-GMP phosphodiesterase, flagellum assembly factor TipF